MNSKTKKWLLCVAATLGVILTVAVAPLLRRIGSTVSESVGVSLRQISLSNSTAQIVLTNATTNVLWVGESQFLALLALVTVKDSEGTEYLLYPFPEGLIVNPPPGYDDTHGAQLDPGSSCEKSVRLAEIRIHPPGSLQANEVRGRYKIRAKIPVRLTTLGVYRHLIFSGEGEVAIIR